MGSEDHFIIHPEGVPHVSCRMVLGNVEKLKIIVPHCCFCCCAMPPTPFRPASRDIPLPQGTSTPSIDKSETVLRERRRSLRSTPQTEEETITTNKNNSPDVFHPSTPFVPCRDVEAAEHWQDWEKPVSGLGFYDFKKGKVIPRSVPDADASSSIHACIADQGPSELWLRGQNLTALHSDIGSLHQLVILDVSHNWLQRLPEELKHCGSHLRILNCSYNCLIELCPKSLGSLIALEELDASHNLLPEVPPAISSLSRLTTLRLNSNKLKRLPFNVGLGLRVHPAASSAACPSSTSATTSSIHFPNRSRGSARSKRSTSLRTSLVRCQRSSAASTVYIASRAWIYASTTLRTSLSRS